MKVQDSVVLLTGANGGIGRAFISELLKRGASKIYLGVRDVSAVQALLGDSDKLVGLELDITNADHLADLAGRAGDVTLLINNAGFAAFSGALSAQDLTNARREMDVNYFGILGLTQALRNTPAFQQGGAIVNLLSILSLVTLPVAGTYSASKAAALALSRTLRAELKPRGVQVLDVLPVQVDTAMGAALPEPRLTPTEVVAATLNALEAGEVEVFPGELSQGAHQAFRGNPEGMQAQMAGMVHDIG